LFAVSTAIHCAGLELLTGDRATAEDGLRRAYDGLASSGEKYLLAPIAALLVQVVSAQGRVDEAEQIARAAGELAASDDVELLWAVAARKGFRLAGTRRRGGAARSRGRRADPYPRSLIPLDHLALAQRRPGRWSLSFLRRQSERVGCRRPARSGWCPCINP
jgi:hypothetical protein